MRDKGVIENLSKVLLRTKALVLLVGLSSLAFQRVSEQTVYKFPPLGCCNETKLMLP